MSALEQVHTGISRSRRNLIRIGAIGASAIFARLANAQLLGPVRPGPPGPVPPGPPGPVPPGPPRPRPGPGAQCFLKGTTIRTANGNRKIEDLAAGDLLPTVFAGTCPIQWIARYSLKKANPSKGWRKQALPVRIARSALDREVPRADLFVTGWHALFIEGALVTAGSLINGTTITVYDPGALDELEFFHIKLACHNVIYAEDVPCETMLTVEESAVNFDEYLGLYGRPATERVRCAPLLSYENAQGEMRSRLRSAFSPWVDRRQPLDIIRDELEERGIANLRGRSFSPIWVCLRRSSKRLRRTPALRERR